jgi:trk system potassium uptake protein TrkA
MKVLIVGAGVVGESLAEQLSEEGHQVAVVDHDRRKVADLGERLDVLAVRGEAGMPSVLERAGIRQAEMVIAVTNVDEINLVVGMLASRMGVRHRIVRLRNQEYQDPACVLPLGDLGIGQIINPEPIIVDALCHMIEIPGANDYATLAGGQVMLLGFDIAADSPAAGRSMAELREFGEMDAILVLYITRGEEVLVPRGEDRIQIGDRVHVLVAAGMIQFLLPFIHSRPPQVRHVIIAGASRIGIQLAAEIQARVERVFLVEPDPQLAEDAAARLDRATVLCGDETDLDVLREASLEACDLFCAVSDSDQRNMLSALLAKKHGRTRAAVVVHTPEYVPVMDSLGIEIVLNPRLVTVGEILMHVRRGLVHSVTRLAERRAEIIDMDVPEGSPAVKARVRDLDFPRNALLGAIVRDGVMQIPNGATSIEPGDRVLVFALPDAIARIEKLFTRRKWFRGL